MKRPSQQLVDAFFQWYRIAAHARNEDYYAGRLTADALRGMSREEFVEFFFQFARDGGKVQSGGARTAPQFRDTIESRYEDFRNFALEPFQDGFVESGWLERTKQFPYFGKGLATIYLNRVDKNRYAIVNNKAIEAMSLLDVHIPGDLPAGFDAIRQAGRQLIEWFPDFENFYRTDALTQFLIGEEVGKPWADALRGTDTSVAQTKSPTVIRSWIYAPGERARLWDQYRAEGTIGIGWSEMNSDLSSVTTEDELRSRYEATYGDDASDSDFRQLADFRFRMQPGDRLFVKRGTGEIVGYGEVQSPYFFDETRSEYRHLRKAKWLNIGTWGVPVGEKALPVKTLTEVKDPRRLQTLLAMIGQHAVMEERNPSYSTAQLAKDVYMLQESIDRWVRNIKRKRQAIVYGPPGTGKTYIAQKLARHLISEGDGLSEMLQFHPSYAYEDFMQGLRPKALRGGGLEFGMVPGRFKDFCERARGCNNTCVLIIDEINRANLARVFGELMYLLEYRGESVPLSGGERFDIPENVVIIGTMNTADRSIALVDHALRRRFAFLPLYPNYDVLRKFHEGSVFNPEGLIAVLGRLNAEINDKHYSVGVTYFLDKEIADKLQDVWQMEIEPYVEELFFDQPAKAKRFAWESVRNDVVSAG